MLYRTINIDPRHGETPSWVCSVHDMDGERKDTYLVPSALGYYHFPRRWPVPRGFAALKAVMVESHKHEIARLQASLEKLQALECPKA